MKYGEIADLIYKSLDKEGRKNGITLCTPEPGFHADDSLEFGNAGEYKIGVLIEGEGVPVKLTIAIGKQAIL